jgi:hypothetical protein
MTNLHDFEARNAKIAEEIAKEQHPDQSVGGVVDNGEFFTVDMSGGQVLVSMSTIRAVTA